MMNASIQLDESSPAPAPLSPEPGALIDIEDTRKSPTLLTVIGIVSLKFAVVVVLSSVFLGIMHVWQAAVICGALLVGILASLRLSLSWLRRRGVRRLLRDAEPVYKGDPADLLRRTLPQVNLIRSREWLAEIFRRRETFDWRGKTVRVHKDEPPNIQPVTMTFEPMSLEVIETMQFATATSVDEAPNESPVGQVEEAASAQSRWR